MSTRTYFCNAIKNIHWTFRTKDLMHKKYYLSNATFPNLATPGRNGKTTFNPTNHVRSLIKLYFLRSSSSPFLSPMVSKRPYKWNVSLKLQQFKMKRLHHHGVARVNMKMRAQWSFFAVSLFCSFQQSNGQMKWKSGNLNHSQLKCMKYLISVKDIIFSLRAGRKPIRYHDKLNTVKLLLSLYRSF